MLNKKQHKKRILFIGEEVTLAHIVRPLTLAASLNKEKYDVFFGSGNKYKDIMEKYHFQFYTLPTISSTSFLTRLKYGRPLYLEEELRAYVDAEIACIEEISPHLIVGDFRLSLGISADLFNIPYVCLSNAHWSPYSTQPFPVPDHNLLKIIGHRTAKILLPSVLPFIFWYHACSFNKLRKSFGLSPIGNLKNIYTYGTWTLYTDIPSIAPTSNLPVNHKYVGPVTWAPDIKLPDWWQKIKNDYPIIYVTMGSSGNTTVLGNILKALNAVTCIGLVATAGRIDIQQFSNKIFIENYLPAFDVIKKASLVICNGGSATAYQALSLGVPILGFPSNADQFFTMESIENNGAGICLRSCEASAENIQLAINQIINNEKFQNSAKKLATEISLYDSKRLFSNFIDSWAGYIA